MQELQELTPLKPLQPLAPIGVAQHSATAVADDAPC